METLVLLDKQDRQVIQERLGQLDTLVKRDPQVTLDKQAQLEL